MILVEVKLPNFHVRSDQMSLRFNVVGGEAHVSPHVFQDKQNFPVASRRETEQKHDFVEPPDLGTGRVAAARPRVGLTLDQHRRALTAQIKFVSLLNFMSDRRAESQLKRDARPGKKQLSSLLEFSTNMSITYGADALEIVFHRMFIRAEEKVKTAPSWVLVLRLNLLHLVSSSRASLKTAQPLLSRNIPLRHVTQCIQQY